MNNTNSNTNSTIDNDFNNDTNSTSTNTDITEFGGRRKRSPPLAQLETLTSHNIWIILLLPFLLAVITIVLDINKGLHREVIRLSSSYCDRPLICHTYDNVLSFEITTDAILLKHILLTGKLHGHMMSDLPSMRTSIEIEAVDSAGIRKQLLLETLTHRLSRYPSWVPLGGFAAERPWLLPQSRYIRGTVTVTSPNGESAEELLDHTSFAVHFQRRSFTALRAALQVILALSSLFVLVAWTRRMVRHHVGLRESVHGSAGGTSSFVSSRYHCCLAYLTPEQIYTFLLLVSLVMWQDLPGAMCTLMLYLFSMEVSETHLFATSLVKLWGQQGTKMSPVSAVVTLEIVGLFFSLLLLSAGVGCGQERGPESRRAVRIAEEKKMEDSWWAVDAFNDSRFRRVSVKGGRSASSGSDVSVRSGPDWLYSSKDEADSSSEQSTTCRDMGMGHGKVFSLCRSYGDLSEEHLPLVRSHPLSPLFFDFIIGKCVVLFVDLVVVTTQNILTFPTVADSITGIHIGLFIEQSLYAVFSIFLVPVRLFWIVLIAGALLESGVQLKATRYMSSRYQHVAFKLFVNQVFMGLGLLCVTYVFQIYRFLSTVTRQAGGQSVSELWESSVVTADRGFGAWGGREAEIGELLYVSGICYAIAFLFAAPVASSYANIYEHSEKGLSGTIHEYRVLEPAATARPDSWRHSNKRKSYQSIGTTGSASSSSYSEDISAAFESDTRGLDLEMFPLIPSSAMRPSFSPRRSKKRNRKMFCLETACIMMECAWQTYFIPLDDPRSEDEAAARLASQDIFATMLGTSAQAKMNVSQYGLRYIRSFLSRRGDISGYLANGSDRIIVSFRGTVGGSNMITDMNMLQTRYPDWTLKKRYLRELFDSLLQSEGVSHTGCEVDTPDEFDIYYNESKSEKDVELGSVSSNSRVEHGDNTDEDRESEKKSSLGECMRAIVSVIPVARHTLPLIHYGFWQAYESIREEFLKVLIIGVLDKLGIPIGALARGVRTDHEFYQTRQPSCDSVGKEKHREFLELYICGHSLGGALSVLAALDVSHNAEAILGEIFRRCPFWPQTHQPKVLLPTVYTFGSPRIGNAQFSRIVEQNIPNLFRVEVDGDIICRMPRWLGMYRHCGIHIIVDAEEGGSLIVNPTIVESQLLRRGSGTTAHHSLSMYRACLEACFLPNELEVYLNKYYSFMLETDKQVSSTTSSSHLRNLPEWL